MMMKFVVANWSMHNRTTIQFSGRRHHAEPQHWTGTVVEGGSAHPDDTLTRVLQPRRRTGIPGLLDCHDEKAGREEQSSLTFDLWWCVSSIVVSCPDPNWEERVWWCLANSLGFISIDCFLGRIFHPPITLQETQSLVATPEILG